MSKRVDRRGVPVSLLLIAALRSPAADDIDMDIDFNNALIHHPNSICFLQPM